jgi:hypothetical protein
MVMLLKMFPDYGDMDATHLEISDFFVDPGSRWNN